MMDIDQDDKSQDIDVCNLVAFCCTINKTLTLVHEFKASSAYLSQISNKKFDFKEKN